MSDSIKELKDNILNFRDARDWKKFHNPKDLAISISLEAAELLEVFQWSGSDVEVDSEKKINKVKEELADVMIYSILMADTLGLDISEIVNNKLEENNKKYPVEKAYGKADKYTAYVNVQDGEEIK
jgi:NTP pyrophosphatase (non-canonical NTP hydrolase)